MEYKR